MTRYASALLPVLRSETQARLLAATLLHPDREDTIAGLARRLAVSPGNLHADVQRMVDSGIFESRRVGRARLVKAARNPLADALRDLVAVAYGPKALLEQALTDLPGIVEASIIGSWAERYTGTPGPPPQDIDVLVIGTPDRDDVHDHLTAVQSQIAVPVQVVFRRPELWATDDDAFARSVREKPVVPLDLRSSADSSRPAAPEDQPTTPDEERHLP